MVEPIYSQSGLTSSSIVHGGEPVSDASDVQATLAAARIGQPLNASVIRGGVETALTITVGERPARREAGRS